MQDIPDVELLRPHRLGWPGPVILWTTTLFLIAYFTMDVWRHGFAPPGRSQQSALALTLLFLGCAALLQYLLMTDRDVVLSVEGVRKGSGKRSVFIRWQGATLRYNRQKRYFSLSKEGARIDIRSRYFDEYRFWEIMHYVRYVAYAQSLKRNAGAAKISTPMHGLNEKDRKAFLKYRGGGFYRNIFWPYLSLPLFAICVAYVALIEVVIRRASVSPFIAPAINAAWRDFPFFFRADVVRTLLYLAFLVGFYLFAQGLPMVLGQRQRRLVRANWLQQFDRAQIISISEIGLQYKDAARQAFYPWNDVTGISEASGLILFDVVPELPLSIMVPKRVFATTADAKAFYRQALDFKRAALTRPNLTEPISFWEIA